MINNSFFFSIFSCEEVSGLKFEKKMSSIASRLFLRSTKAAHLQVPRRHLNLLEYQSKGLLQEFDVTVQKFRVASNSQDAEAIPKQFPCKEYVIKAQVLAGGRGKGHFDNGFKVNFISSS
jgi:succinyl-CoA synthetase beta subunit